jgi:hypothetical protein
MQTFSLLIFDDRHALPIVSTITVGDRAEAAEVARRRLAESPHQLSIELFEDNAPLALFDWDGEVWRKGKT